MDEKQLQFLFDNYGKSKGFVDFNEFKSLMQNEGSRKVFFDDSNKDLGFKDYNDFEVTIGVKKKMVATLLHRLRLWVLHHLPFPNHNQKVGKVIH